MKGYLADTHVVLWWASDAPRLLARHREILANGENAIFVSAVSVWEATIKVQSGKLSLPLSPLGFFQKLIEVDGFLPLPIHFAHAAGVASLPKVHNDPFDRLLISQACHEGLTLLSEDQVFASYELPGLVGR